MTFSYSTWHATCANKTHCIGNALLIFFQSISNILVVGNALNAWPNLSATQHLPLTLFLRRSKCCKVCLELFLEGPQKHKYFPWRLVPLAMHCIVDFTFIYTKRNIIVIQPLACKLHLLNKTVTPKAWVLLVL